MDGYHLCDTYHCVSTKRGEGEGVCVYIGMERHVDLGLSCCCSTSLIELSENRSRVLSQGRSMHGCLGIDESECRLGLHVRLMVSKAFRSVQSRLYASIMDNI